MGRKEELKNIVDEARKELNEIEHEEFTKKYIGKYYKYKKKYLYSNPIRDSWWRYDFISYRDSHNNLRMLEFEKEINGQISIIQNAYGLPDTSWIEITADEFWEEWNKIVEEINQMQESLTSSDPFPNKG